MNKENKICKNKSPHKTCGSYCFSSKEKKINMRNVCWGVKNIGGGNLDILAKQMIPGICNKHQRDFLEIIECNDCDVRLN